MLYGDLSFSFSAVLFEICLEKILQFVPGNHVLGLTFACFFLVTAVVEVAMGGIGVGEAQLRYENYFVNKS